MSPAAEKTYRALTTLPGGVAAGTIVTVDASDEQVKRHLSAGLLEEVKGNEAKGAVAIDMTPATPADVTAGTEPPAS